MISVGGGFNATYGGDGSSSNALSGPNNGDVLTSIDQNLNTAIAAIVQPNSGGLPAVNPSTAVDNTNHTIEFGTADNLATGNAVAYSSGGGSPINGLQDGHTYFVIADGPNKIQLAATYNDALAGNAIPITTVGTTGTNHTFSNNAAGVDNTATSNNGSALPGNNAVSGGTNLPGQFLIASGTTAALDGGAVISATTVAIDANQTFTLNDVAGGIGIGLGAVGIGLAIVNVDSNVSAYIGPRVTVNEISSGGSLDVDATRNATLNVVGFAGAESGFVSLGAAVAVVTDDSNVQALIGGVITDSGIQNSAGSGDETTIDSTGTSGFAVIGVDAENTLTIEMSTGAANISLGAGLGASIVVGDFEGNTQGLIGNFVTMGTTTSGVGTAPVGSVSVTANRTVTVGPNSPGGPMAIGLSGGLILGGAACFAQVTVGGSIIAGVGDNSDIDASGDVSIKATTTDTVTMLLDGGAGGAIAVGAMIAKVTMSETVTASVGTSTTIKGKTITISATGTPSASLTSTPGAGGILSGVGSEADATFTPTISATVGDSARLTSTVGDIKITSTSSPSPTTDAEGHDYGGVVDGQSKTTITLTNNNTASIGKNAIISAEGNFSLLATTTDNPSATATGSAGALVPIAESDTTVTIMDTTKTSVGSGTQITATGGVANTIPDGTIGIEADLSITATSNPTVNTGGLGSSSTTTGNLTITANTTTDVGSNVLLTGGTVNVLARVLKINAQSDSEASADAIGAASTANDTVSTTSTDTVTIESGAVITGQEQVNIKARQEDLGTTLAKANAVVKLGDAKALGGNSEATANNTLNTTTTVTAMGTAQVETRTLFVEAYADPSPGFTADAEYTGALLSSNFAHPTQVLDLIRNIAWNASILILGEPNPELTIGSTGAILKQVGITFSQNPNGTYVINDIINQGSLAGMITFSIAGSTYDSNPTIANTTITSSGVLTGAPQIVFQTGFGFVAISNATGNSLEINEINAVDPVIDFTGDIIYDVPNASAFAPVTTSTPGHTVITIANTANAPADITFEKLIYNPFGTTSAITDGGNIISGSNAATITTTSLVLDAPSGFVGTVHCADRSGGHGPVRGAGGQQCLHRRDRRSRSRLCRRDPQRHHGERGVVDQRHRRHSGDRV